MVISAVWSVLVQRKSDPGFGQPLMENVKRNSPRILRHLDDLSLFPIFFIFELIFLTMVSMILLVILQTNSVLYLFRGRSKQNTLKYT